MSELRHTIRGTPTELSDEWERRRLPRNDIVAETAVPGDDGEHRFEAAEGPFDHYERVVELRPDASTAEGWTLTETIRYRLAVPVWAWLFWWPVRRALRHRQARHAYWWAPPDRLDSRCATVMGLLCTAQVVDGYLGTVLTQTLTFAADEFGHGNTAQGVVLGAVRAGVLLALVVVAAADRHGRKRLLTATGVASCVTCALGAAAPALWFLGGTQLVARGLSTALGVLIAVVAAEEMPARSRAWAASVLVLCAGLGSGMAVWVLPVADLGLRAWRVVYLVPLAGVAVMVWVGRRLPESRRFMAALQGEPASSAPVVGAEDSAARQEAAERRRRRLVLLGAAAFLVAMFAAPASSLQNDFLKDERGYSAAAISVFTLATSTPAGIGVLVGGYLADRRGRRPVGAFGLTFGALFTALAYFATGAGLWLATLAGTIVGGLTVPALAVYGPELFGTINRGRANGVIVTVGVTGSAVGLLATGVLSDALGGRIGPALALLAVGPLIVAVLVLTRFPETAGVELEELNPEDTPTDAAHDAGTPDEPPARH